MQTVCLFLILQFHLMIDSLTLGYQIMEVGKNGSQEYLLVIGSLQFVTHTSLLFIILLRPKYQTKKNYVYSLMSLGVALSVVMISLNYSSQLLILGIIQLQSLIFLVSFMVIPGEKIALGVIVQIYTLGLAMNLTPFYLWSIELFTLSRAIAIIASTAFGFITFSLCLLCLIKMETSFKQDLHIIVGFYIFCEIFTCCMFGAEASQYYQNSYSGFNVPIIFTILKISNLFLDILIYPFAKYKKVERVTISQVIPDKLEKSSNFFAMVTKETDTDCNSATKISDKKEPKRQSSVKWIKRLLEIY